MSDFCDSTPGVSEHRLPEDDSPINRQSLADGSLVRRFTNATGSDKVLSEAERAARFESLLASVRQGDDLWLFAYGSMIWNPTVHYAEARVVRVSGWHRSFCLRSTAGRGSEQHPGLMLGIEPGGDCEGLAYRLPHDKIRPELHLLWQREMVTGVYHAGWLKASCRQQREIDLVGFVIDPQATTYEGALPLNVQAARIARAAGLLGSNRDYLLRTRHHLRQHGVHDGYIEQLASEVERLSQGG